MTEDRKRAGCSRAIREEYLIEQVRIMICRRGMTADQIAEAQQCTAMTAYNRIRGVKLRGHDVRSRKPQPRAPRVFWIPRKR